MAPWNGLVVQPPIGEDGELAEPEAPAGIRSPLPALPARAELRDATAEEQQAIANFDIRAFA